MAALRAGVLRYYAYKATSAVELYRPTMYLYFLSVGLSFTQIAVLEAAYNVTTVLAEVPTGYVGDRIGRRNSLIVGTVIIAVTLLGIALAGSFPALLALYVCWSVGYTFRSGTEDAWLYDSLTGDGAASFTAVRGRGQSVALAVGVVGSVVGGALAARDLALPFLAAAAVTAVGVPVLLTVDDRPHRRPDAGGGDEPSGAGSPVLTPRRALAAVRAALADRRVRAFVVYHYVLFSAATYLLFILLQPRLETLAPTLGLASARVEPLLGWYYAAIALVSAAATFGAEPVRERVGLRTWFLVVPPLVGLVLVVQWWVPLLAVPGFVLVRALGETTGIFAAQFVNDRVASLGRATVLSAMAMVSGLTVVPFQLGGGVVSDVADPGLALAAVGGVLLVGAGVVLLVADPLPRRSQNP